MEYGIEKIKQKIIWFMTLIFKYKSNSNTNDWNGFEKLMLFTVTFPVTFAEWPLWIKLKVDM